MRTVPAVNARATTTTSLVILCAVPLDLDWDGCRNVRDLGGFDTGAGITAFRVFVRGDNARRLSSGGWRAARDYGVATILDLRSEPECTGDPPAPSGFVHRRLSLFDTFDRDLDYRRDLEARMGGLDAAIQYGTLYREALELDAERFAEAASVLADAGGVVFFHCVGGKDRSGLLAALVLRLVGVSRDAVEADYVRSELRLGTGARAPAGVVNAAVDTVERRHGSVGAYFEAAGLSSPRLRAIRGKLAGF